MRLRRATVAGALVAASLGSVGTVATGSQAAPPRPGGAELPLGSPGLAETRTSEVLAPGVTMTTITRGRASAADFWTVTAGFYGSRPDADAAAARLRGAGFDPRVEQVDGRAQDDPEPGPVGFVVRTGRGASEAEMKALAARMTAAGLPKPSVTHTSLDGSATSGPWVLHVLDVDQRRHAGAVRVRHAGDVVAAKERVTSIAGRTGALAAVNGGYFVVGPQDGTPGAMAGLSVIDGSLQSRSLRGRAALVLDGRRRRASVQRVTTPMTVTADDDASRVLNGRDRKPGLARSCGIPGARPTESPKHDVTCSVPDDLVQIDAAYGRDADPGPGVQAALDAEGTVLRVDHRRGGPVPPGGSLLEGTGDAAAWLDAHAEPGSSLDVRSLAVDENGRRLDLARPGTDAVNGGPLLVRDRRPYVDAAAEGFVQPDQPSFYYGFGVRRNPRTMAGTTADGHLLLVTADGRAPGYSVGLSFREEADVMAALGSRDALNLDGGGSTTTVGPGAALVGRPSDSTGERPVGDAVLVLPPTAPRREDDGDGPERPRTGAEPGDGD